MLLMNPLAVMEHTSRHRRGGFAMMMTLMMMMLLLTVSTAFAPPSTTSRSPPLQPLSVDRRRRAVFSSLHYDHQVRQRRPHGRMLLVPLASTASTTAEDTSDNTKEHKKNFLSRLTSGIPPAAERQKLVPLALMFFCILFNYTILRDTKDVLMVTAPKSGAEVIPFIKTYCNLPVAIVRIASL
jgi:TLC ATP/ADP transporter